MIAAITVEQLQACAWEQWQAWRAEHPGVTKESDESAWWGSRGEVSERLTPSDDATLRRMVLTEDVIWRSALDQPGADLRSTVRSAIDQAIGVYIQDRAPELERAPTLDLLIAEARRRFDEWRQRHPDASDDEAVEEAAEIGAAVAPHDSPSLRVLAMDDRVWSIGARYTLSNTSFHSMDTIVTNGVEHLISDPLYSSLGLGGPTLAERVAALDAGGAA